ncbi:MAG: hypothetical protein CVU32_00395 [Betaproteobacteria bacterium HGW-Betaproteobacteria-5]|jgi:hypothetical protein|nr:MAG: hypothetical protein CVU32_00395 [Betaproteobacteria bacterium HGW-Betaproteobacteria-5]PKO41120.1 MAG: hypothetical protein CVU33_00995 [Betaproteobacteria bacterium HGW-Betaproteobacteria-6]
MHIRKYDFDYSRRAFIAKMGTMAGAGILTPLWPLIAKGADITKAYPDELLSIDAYTKGKVKTGDLITAANVDIVKDLLTPIAYKQVKEMGRRIRIVPTTKDVSRLFPHDYLEATLKNAGKAKLDSDGNVYTSNGERWIGGNPFPDAKTALEAFANITLSWGRHDSAVYAMRDWDIGPDGKVSYQYDFGWYEENVSGRLSSPGGFSGDTHKDKLRYQTVLFSAPSDVRGTAYLSTWNYDQRKFPELVGYVPAFKRVRKFPTNQRFEPLAPGLTFYLSDAWGSGDPMLTWGNYKLVERRPMLGAVSQNQLEHPNWEMPVHGGPAGQTFFEISMELIPECLVLDAEPVGYPRAPVGKKRVWLDARNMMYIGYHTYDRRGELFKSFEPTYSLLEKGNVREMTGKHTAWTWTSIMSHDIQSNRMSRIVQAKEIAGGIKSVRNPEGIYDKYLTEQAISRLGA